jgi:hypothetical protein
MSTSSGILKLAAAPKLAAHSSSFVVRVVVVVVFHIPVAIA